MNPSKDIGTRSRAIFARAQAAFAFMAEAVDRDFIKTIPSHLPKLRANINKDIDFHSKELLPHYICVDESLNCAFSSFFDSTTTCFLTANIAHGHYFGKPFEIQRCTMSEFEVVSCDGNGVEDPPWMRYDERGNRVDFDEVIDIDDTIVMKQIQDYPLDKEIDTWLLNSECEFATDRRVISFVMRAEGILMQYILEAPNEEWIDNGYWKIPHIGHNIASSACKFEALGHFRID